MPTALWCLAGIFLIPSAFADVSLVQVVQSQTSQGSDGLFGKTWTTVSGRKMRIVSGFARKVPTEDEKFYAAPARLVQILNLDTTSLLRLDPVSKTFEERPFADIRYADSLHERLSLGRPSYTIARSTVTLEQGRYIRKYMGTDCKHHHILVSMSLEGPQGESISARMTQDVWVAPVLGGVQKSLLDIISFEVAYRNATRDAFTPLDYETYQLREAAAYLRVRPQELSRVVAEVKKAFIEIPGYPLSSSVAWWREPDVSEPPPAPRPPRRRTAPPRRRGFIARLVPVRPFYSTGFRPINWHDAWNEIDGMIVRAGESFGRFPSGAMRGRRPSRPLRYADFQRELQEVVSGLSELVEDAREPEPERPSRPSGAPFYEIFAEIHQLEFVEPLPAGHFLPPQGYTRKR